MIRSLALAELRFGHRGWVHLVNNPFFEPGGRRAQRSAALFVLAQDRVESEHPGAAATLGGGRTTPSPNGSGYSGRLPSSPQADRPAPLNGSRRVTGCEW
jgi:hypothetical protein